MRESLTTEQLNTYLQELMTWKALEICVEEGPEGTVNVRIPYVMNDAVECFLYFPGVKIHGEWDPNYEGEQSFLTEEQESVDTRRGLFFRQGTERALSIWFRDAFREVNCYQYHRIGHQWRKEKGEEKWRRLVNLLCVLHDKAQFLGLQYCNETEAELKDLIEFAPLCYWSPIDQSILEWYPETAEGMAAMQHVAKMTGQQTLLELLQSYHEQKSGSRKRERQMRRAAQELISSESIYCYLADQLEQASLCWPVRRYSAEQEQEMNRLRERAAKKVRENGYMGEYPNFYLSKTDDEEKKRENMPDRVLMVEEHPFTVMESEEYHFSVFAMEE